MAMERVTVEQNGERFTLEVPEGTSDADIQSFVGQQSAQPAAGVNPAPQVLNAVKNTLVTPTSGYPSSAGAGYGAGPVTQFAEQATRGGIRDLASVGKILYNEVTPGVAAHWVTHPIKSLRKGVQSYVAGHPWANATLRDAVSGATSGVRNVGGALVRGALGPESMFAAPYQMAAYEQEKIRQNPTAAEYANNPYAMVQRGLAQTQGQAGAMNQRAAVQNFNTAGNPAPGTPAFAAMQAPATPSQPPTAMNFIQRMEQLAHQYGPYRNFNQQ